MCTKKSYILENSSEQQQTERQIYCDPCLFGNVKTEATRFCKTCLDPEPLCEVCAQLHTRQKATKNHMMCEDIRQFPNLQDALNERYNRLIGHISPLTRK